MNKKKNKSKTQKLRTTRADKKNKQRRKKPVKKKAFTTLREKNKAGKNKRLTEKHKISIIKSILSGFINITQAAKINNVSRGTIYRWINLYKAGKSLKIERNPKAGAQEKISKNIQKKIFHILTQLASKYGFETDLWTIRRLQQILKDLYGIEVAKMTVWRLLTKNGYTPKKAQKQYFEANLKDQKEWQKTIKKNSKN
jgi:transposase